MEDASRVDIFIKPIQVFAYAGFWRRFAASLVDGLILSLIASILGFGIGYIWFTQVGDDEISRTVFSAILDLIILVISWFYYAVQESSESGATIGKRIMGIFVTDTQGAPISFGRASGRYFSKVFLSSILLIGYLLAGFTTRKQALHDLIAGTLVIHAHS